MKEVQATFPTLDPLHTYTPYMLYAHDRFIELFSLLDDPGAIKKSRRRRKRKMTYCDAICTDSEELIFLNAEKIEKVGICE